MLFKESIKTQKGMRNKKGIEDFESLNPFDLLRGTRDHRALVARALKRRPVWL
jgi:ABC-type thiamine transport system ATPase subunit